MTPEQYQRAKSIFLEACDFDADEAAGHIARSAPDDDVVRVQALRMLEHDRGASTANEAMVLRGVEQLLETSPHTAAAASLDMPETIGPYRIVRRVGSGGMGDVFEAQQDSPRRRVALKLLRAGLASPSMLRRFEQEIQFAGRLSHPGIAQVYEAGVAQVGATPIPYFAMEFIDGRPLTTFAREHGLALQQKLHLFASICDSVQYAHQQGVIHRDLKPANILVQEEATSDTNAGSAPVTRAGTSLTHLAGGATARILDFGIARSVRADPAQTQATLAGQVVGTIAYASPEQITGRTDGIDTRTDVYSLGVILFELLTGTLPFETDGVSIVEAARLKSQQAPRRLSSMDRSLRGDLETIAAKALETDKARRYASASELGADVRRFLNNEVITARPATALYQARMFAKRNRAVVVAGALAVAALIGGIIATSLQARATRVQAQAALADRDIAQRKTAVAEGVSDMLLEALTVATPNGKGKYAKVMDAVAQMEERFDTKDTKVAPEVQAIILNIVGIIHREHADYDLAEARFQKALEIRRQVLDPGDPNLADSLNNMGLLRKRQGRLEEAMPYFQEAIDLQRASTFRDDDRLLRNLYNLATAHLDLARDATPGDHVGKAKVLLAESFAIQRRLHGENNPIGGLMFSAQSRVALEEGRWGEAEELAERALRVLRFHVGEVHPHVMNGLRDLARIKAKQGDRPRGTALLAEADAMAVRIYEEHPGHPMRRSIRAELVQVLRDAGRVDEAERLERDAAASL